MELAKYYEVFSAQAKVVLEAGVDLFGESMVSLPYREACEKDDSLSERPVWRDMMVKIKLGLKEVDYLKVIMWDAHCRQ